MLFKHLTREEDSITNRARIVSENLGEAVDAMEKDIGRPWMFGEWSEDDSKRYVRDSLRSLFDFLRSVFEGPIPK